MLGRIQFELLLDDRHRHVDANGDPDLRPHGVLRGAVKTLDSQMLLDPFEEQLLPAIGTQSPFTQSRFFKEAESCHRRPCLADRRRRFVE